MIDIHNRVMLKTLLGQLPSDASPLFGQFNPQQMVEHLTMTVQISNGQLPDQLFVPENKAAAIKSLIIHSDQPMPLGVKNPLVSEASTSYSHALLSEAITALLDALNDFDLYFQASPDTTRLNPVMGALNYSEWVVFHNKHFTHHFKQFGLLPS